MNEELKIVIKAITSEAKKNISAVKQELEKVETTGTKSGKSIKQTMKSIAKVSAVAVASVTAITAALVKLGQSAKEFNTIQSKLISGFQAAGATAKQASETYKGFFRFLGEADRAGEAANHLAKMTTNEQELAEWTKICQGIFATFGDSLPIEGLTEAANETARVGKVTGVLADALNWAGVSEDDFNNALANMNSLAERESYIRGTLNNLYSNAAMLYERNNQAAIQYNEAQYRLNVALSEAGKYVIPLMTQLSNLATVVLQVLKPAFEVISGVIIVFVQWIIAAVQYIGTFFGLFSDKGTSSVKKVSNSISAVNSGIKGSFDGINGLGGAFDNATKSAEKLKKATMGFDELNVLSNPKTGSSGSSSASGGGPAYTGGGISVPQMDPIDFTAPDLSNFQETVDEIKKDLGGIITLIGLAAAGFATWKISDFFITMHNLKNDIFQIYDDGKGNIGNKYFKEANNELKAMHQKIKTLIGNFMIIAGVILTIKGYSDAWVNGIDWKNFTEILAGLALVIGGISLAFGKLATSISVATGGISLIILGVKDFIKNGPTLQNTILIIGGAIAIAVGLATAGISVIISAIVGAVAAIGAFVASILSEEPAIKTVQQAQEELTAAKQAATDAENTYINAIDSAEASLNKLTEAEARTGLSGEELYKQVQAGTLDYANMTDAQREVYKAYLDNEQKQRDLEESTRALNDAKKAETIASYENQLALAKESGDYESFKKSVVDAFNNGMLSADEARDLIGKSMSEMSDDSQKTFMQDIPSDIKNGLDPSKYETTGKKIKDWFGNLWGKIKDGASSAWNWVKQKFSDFGEWFGNMGRKAGEAVGSAFKSVINWVLDKVEKTINIPIRGINSAIGIINKIPGVKIGLIGELKIPRLAKGGIATFPTLAEIGERGPEAVLPLSGPQSQAWMNTLSDMIAQKSGSNSQPTKVILQVGERELGWATIGAINGITEQTGTLQLTFA